MENGLSADLEADHKDLLFMLENKMTHEEAKKMGATHYDEF